MLPAAFVFCFGGKFVFEGRAFACTAGFFPRFGGSSVARPRRGEGTPLYCAQTSSLLLIRPSGAPPLQAICWFITIFQHAMGPGFGGVG